MQKWSGSSPSNNVSYAAVLRSLKKLLNGINQSNTASILRKASFILSLEVAYDILIKLFPALPNAATGVVATNDLLSSTSATASPYPYSLTSAKAYFFFSSRRRHTRFALVSWARHLEYERG